MRNNVYLIIKNCVTLGRLESQRAAKAYVDSTAAISASQRRGNGKQRHVKVGISWVQEILQKSEMTVCKVLYIKTSSRCNVKTSFRKADYGVDAKDESTAKRRKGRSESAKSHAACAF